IDSGPIRPVVLLRFLCPTWQAVVSIGRVVHRRHCWWSLAVMVAFEDTFDLVGDVAAEAMVMLLVFLLLVLAVLMISWFVAL
ncbi:hypothetical protein, partial [Escherichia marmotae]|uniref:hypothetical protein n=1 Tax=Escherichia marmotae TaxID=1499973 RepID=UPI0020012130